MCPRRPFENVSSHFLTKPLDLAREIQFLSLGSVSMILGVPLLHCVRVVSLYIGSFMAYHGMKATG